MTAGDPDRVIVVGAGPVGLTAALVLARQSVPVLLIDCLPGLSEASRASTFHPATLDLLSELGVAEALRSLGRRVDSLQWRSLSHGLVAEMPYRLLAGHTGHPYRLHVEQAELTRLLLAELHRHSNVDIRWNTRVHHAENGGRACRLVTRTGAGTADLEARYVIAADGAHSAVRSSLGMPFRGREYPSYALRIITDTPLDELIPGASAMTYIRDPRQSCSLLGLVDHWRMILRLPHSITAAQALDPSTVEGSVAKALPAGAAEIRIRDAHTYRTSRRVADSYRLGNVFFVGDAAHLTSTAGGMNMNCGLHDAFDIADVVARHYHGTVDDGELNHAADRRRSIVLDRIIPRTEARVAGVAEADSAVLATSLRELVETAADPERATAYLFEASMLDSAPEQVRSPIL